MLLADKFQTTMSVRWNNPNNEDDEFINALRVAETLGAEIHKARGGTSIAEFMDGSFALISSHGQSILATWLEEDTEQRI